MILPAVVSGSSLWNGLAMNAVMFQRVPSNGDERKIIVADRNRTRPVSKGLVDVFIAQHELASVFFPLEVAPA